MSRKWKRGTANAALAALEYISDRRNNLTAEQARTYAETALGKAIDDQNCDVIVHLVNAAPKLANMVLATKPNTMDGRSKWKWVRLANGDLLLACYPCGDTYEIVTQTVNFPV